MANENKENNPIPLGGNIVQGNSASTEMQTSTKKKVSPVVIVISVIAAILVVLAIAVGVIFALATSDTMPKAPKVSTDMSTLIKDSALEMLQEKKISFTSDEVNLCLQMLVEKSSDKLEENGIKVNDLFVVINNDKATIYCRAVYKGITLPIRAVVNINYDDPYIVIGFTSASIGKLELPTDLLIEYAGKNINVEDISIHNGFIYYDTTTFNDKLSDITLNALGLTSSDVAEEEENSENEEGFSLSKWWNDFIGGISDSFKDWAAKLVSDIIHEINFKDVKILDDQIVIEVDLSKADTAENTTSADTAA